MMDCPYCNCLMDAGNLRSSGEGAIYWLPRESNKIFSLLTSKKVEKRHGIVLDKLMQVGFYAKERPECYYCRNCGIFLTRMPVECNEHGN